MIAGAKRGGTLRMMGWPLSPSHFDTHQGQSAGNLVCCAPVFDQIVRMDPLDGHRTLAPDLATKWDISGDGLTYTFSFRNGVKFHDGTAFTAGDAAHTMTRNTFPPKGVVAPRAAFLAPVVDKIEVVDPQTMRVTLKQPFAPFLGVLANGFMVVMQKAQVESAGGDMRNIPITKQLGTGPFAATDHKQNEMLVFTRNPTYWNSPRPFVDVYEHYVGTKAASTAAYRTGKVDFYYGPPPADVTPLKATFPDSRMIEGPSFVIVGLFYNTTRPPFNNKLVRQAVNMVIYRDDAVAARAADSWARLGGFLAPGTTYAETTADLRQRPGYAKVTQQTINDAKRLLQQAGYGSGFGTEVLIRGTSGAAVEIDTPLVIEALRPLGITVTSRPTEQSVWYDTVVGGKFDFTYTSVGLTLADPYENLASYYLDPKAATNYGRYDNPQLAALIRQIGVTLDGPERAAQVKKALDILYEEVPMSMLLWSDFPFLVRGVVKGTSDSLLGLYQEWRWDTIWLDR